MDRPNFSLQPLEARRFLSATAVHLHECPEVVEARENVQELTLELRKDRYRGRAALAEIRAQVVAELQELYESGQGDEVREAVAPLYKELREAFRAQGEARRGVIEELQAVREEWHPILEADIKAVREAHAAGDEEALAEAKAKAEADRKAFYAELNPLKQKLQDVTEAGREAITEARIAIEDKLAEFSDELKDLLDDLRTKAAEVEAELTAGHNAVMAARQTLAEEIEECRAEHAEEQALA
jgi:hypothetical protein